MPNRNLYPTRMVQESRYFGTGNAANKQVGLGHARCADRVGEATLIDVVKAGSRISGDDLRGLRRLKERLGDRLEEAITLYTGAHAYTHDGRVTVLPLSRL